MNEALIHNWNKKITNRDKVYHLGDFSFGDEQQTIKIIERLNGQINLIKGNHDSIAKKRNVINKLGFVKDYYELKEKQVGHRIIMFHYPIMSWNAKHHGSIHLYGHVHSGGHRDRALKEGYSMNVGVDVNGYEPVSLDEILDRLKIKI